jgi:hypothetical protein
MLLVTPNVFRSAAITIRKVKPLILLLTFIGLRTLQAGGSASIEIVFFIQPLNVATVLQHFF